MEAAHPLVKGIEPPIDTVESSIDGIKPRIDAIEPRIDAIEPRIDAIKSRIDAIKSRIDAIKSLRDTIESIDHLPHRVLVHLADFLKQLALEGQGRGPDLAPQLADDAVAHVAHLGPYGRKLHPHLGAKLQNLTGQVVNPAW